MFHFYDLPSYQEMLRYPSRVEAYTQILEHTVKPGMIILELGTGFGYFALLAAKLGAKKVYAVEPNAVVRIGRELAVANQLSSKIEFIEDYSTRLNLPEKADICVSDLAGTLPFFQIHIPSIIDARTRLLKPEGQLIPIRDTVYVACVDAPNAYPEILPNEYGLDFSLVQHYSHNQIHYYSPPAAALLTDAQIVAELNYTTIDTPVCDCQLVFRMKRTGVMHGYSFWFERDLGQGFGYSTALDAPKHTYHNIFLPLQEAIKVQENDEVKLSLRLNYSLETHYTYSWQTEYKNIHYQQSTFWGNLYQSETVFRKKP